MSSPTWIATHRWALKNAAQRRSSTPLGATSSGRNLRLESDKRHVTLVHKGNIMKFTEGAFRDWGYELATTEFRDVCITERESWILGNLEKDATLSVQANARMIEPGYDSLTPEKKANSIFQQIQTRPQEYSILARLMEHQVERLGYRGFADAMFERF